MTYDHAVDPELRISGTETRNSSPSVPARSCCTFREFIMVQKGRSKDAPGSRKICPCAMGRAAKDHQSLGNWAARRQDGKSRVRPNCKSAVGLA